MKILLALLLCLVPFLSHATMMTDFTEDTTPSSTDIVWTTKNPGTTPLDRKVSIANLFSMDLTLPASYTLSKVNAAGGSADALTLSGTLGAMNGSDIFSGIKINYQHPNPDTHTGVNNAMYALWLKQITASGYVNSVGMYVESGWDAGIALESPLKIYAQQPIYLWDSTNTYYAGIKAATGASGSYIVTLPPAVPTVTSLLQCGADSVCVWVDTSSIAGSITASGVITDEQLLCGETSAGSNQIKSCGAKVTDNSTTSTVLCKDNTGQIINCTLAGLAISGTTTQTLTVEAMPSNATVNAAGEMTVDTTTDQIRWYGTAQQQLSPKLTFSVVVPSVADTDDMLIMKAPYGMKLLALDCIVSAATSATINIQECDGTGASCADNATSDLVCDVDGATTSTFGGASGDTIDSGDWIKLDVASISGTPGTLTVTVTYSIVAD